MSRLRKVAPLLSRRADTKVLKPKPKVADEVYRTMGYVRWRDAVVRRAGGRCQAMDGRGMRCAKHEPIDRMYADHIQEVSDGGAPYDVTNGQCLCSSHHALKTLQARAYRLGR